MFTRRSFGLHSPAAHAPNKHRRAHANQPALFSGGGKAGLQQECLESRGEGVLVPHFMSLECSRPCSKLVFAHGGVHDILLMREAEAVAASAGQSPQGFDDVESFVRVELGLLSINLRR